MTDHDHTPFDKSKYGDIQRGPVDPDAPLQTRVGEVCACGTVLRVNIAAGPRAVRLAVSRFRDRHTGPGHGPGELVIDKHDIGL